MKSSLSILAGFLLSTVAATASVITNCPTLGCAVLTDIESTSGNLGTVEIHGNVSSMVPGTDTFILSPVAFVTAGPVRSGVIVLSLGIDGDASGGGSSFGTGNLGPYSCSASASVLVLCYVNSSQTVTLGQLIPIQMLLTIGTSSNGRLSGGDRDVRLLAQFFESDGTTPVSVSLIPIPEPGSAWLCTGALMAAIFRIRKVRRTTIPTR